MGTGVLDTIVMVGCVVVLTGLALSIVPKYRNAAGKLQSKGMTNQITVAVHAYHTEYGEWPPLRPPGAPNVRSTKDEWVGDPSMGAPMHNNTLLFTLRDIPKGPNANHAANPQRIVFFVGKAATVSSRQKPRSGVFDIGFAGSPPPPELEGCLFDPWGQEYGIVIDTSGDDRIDLSDMYVDLTHTPPRKNVGVFSAGMDEALGTQGDRRYRKGSSVSDDAISWE